MRIRLTLSAQLEEKKNNSFHINDTNVALNEIKRREIKLYEKKN